MIECMKSLLILRHAKSSWKHPDVNDHDRPLNKRGASGMHHIWESFQQNEHLVPYLIISSTAKRRYSIAKAVAKAAAYGDIALNQSLYAAPPTAYIDVLRNLSNEYARVLMVGRAYLLTCSCPVD